MGLLGVVYLNVKKGHMSKEDARHFLEDALEHGYRISEMLMEQMFKSL